MARTVKAKQAKAETKDLAEPYEPTPRENRALAAQEQRRQNRGPSPRMKIVGEGDAYQIEPDHEDVETGLRLIMESLGTSRHEFAARIIAQIGALVQRGGTLDESEFNSVLALVKGIEPRDELEGMLATQMAAIHNATMDYARRLNNSDTLKKVEVYERTFNKLARTFAAQVETLKKYRSKGEQKVTVEHVHVHEGGQAVVGNVSHGGRGD